MFRQIALDGPSGAGKSTLAKILAAKLGFVYVDTGALYRTVGLCASRHGVSADRPEGVIALLPEIRIDLRYIDGAQHVLLGGEDVSDAIRTPEISKYASAVSALPEVRTFLLGLQKEIASTRDVIMDGRDIGTVILPNADVKIFLTSSPLARAKRRQKELAEKGIVQTVEEVLADMKARDDKDSSRATAPLKKADDAIELDNSELTLEGTVDAALKIIEEKLK